MCSICLCVSNQRFMRKITADWLFPIASEPIKNGVLIVDKAGKILKIDRRENHDLASLEQHSGVLVPGDRKSVV